MSRRRESKKAARKDLGSGEVGSTGAYVSEAMIIITFCGSCIKKGLSDGFTLLQVVIVRLMPQGGSGGSGGSGESWAAGVLNKESSFT